MFINTCTLNISIFNICALPILRNISIFTSFYELTIGNSSISISSSSGSVATDSSVWVIAASLYNCKCACASDCFNNFAHPSQNIPKHVNWPRLFSHLQRIFLNHPRRYATRVPTVNRQYERCQIENNILNSKCISLLCAKNIPHAYKM